MNQVDSSGTIQPVTIFYDTLRAGLCDERCFLVLGAVRNTMYPGLRTGRFLLANLNLPSYRRVGNRPAVLNLLPIAGLQLFVYWLSGDRPRS